MSRLWIALALLGLAASGAAHPARADDWVIGAAQAAPQPAPLPPPLVLKFDIAPQALITALESYGAATGLQILYDSRLAANRQAQPVHGTFDSDSALAALLFGTGLSAIHTAHNVVTLILSPTVIEYADAPPINAPTLPLQALHVDAPPQEERHTLYASTVRFAVQAALIGDREVREGSYHLDINVWVGPNGTIQRLELIGHSGNVLVDRAIAQAIGRIAIGQAPPHDLPQPVHVNIVAQGSG